MNNANKILLISSREKIPQAFLALLAGLKERGADLLFLAARKNGLEKIDEAGLKTLYFPIPKISGLPACLFLAVTLPLRFAYYRIKFSQFKNPKAENRAILLGLAEKLLFTGALARLGFKVYWIEFPEKDYASMHPFCAFFYKKTAKKVELLAFTTKTEDNLRNFGCKNISKVPLAIISKGYRRQDSIFEKIAAQDGSRFHKKFYTIGTVAEKSSRKKIELLFQAAKKSLDSAPNIQLVVIGDCGDKREMSWLVKKLEIDNIVWFVGEQKFMGKWLDSLDLFIATFETPGLDDYETVLKSMSRSLPVIGPLGKGLEEIIIQNKTGSLLEMDNSEMLARQIIRLHQDRRLSAFLGQNAKAYVDNLEKNDNIAVFYEKLMEFEKGR